MKTKFLSFIAALLFITAANAQNVGVGTTTPIQKLDVVGNINIPLDSI